MSADGDIQAALFGAIEANITGYTFVWPKKAEDKPAGEHIDVKFLPNNNRRFSLSGNCPMERKGFVILNLISAKIADDDQHEVVQRDKAGAIAEAIPLDTAMTSGTATVYLQAYHVKPGLEVGGRWEIPVWLEYFGAA